MPERDERLKAISHIVYEYANLIASGEMLQAAFKPALVPPANTLVQQAFLLSCRKMADFFLQVAPKQDDVNACHYLNPEFDLPTWREWKEAVNKQLAHITYYRTSRAKAWTGRANQPLLEEFRAAWRQFLARLEEPYKSEFDQQITKRQSPNVHGRESEYRRFDLR